MCKFIKESIAPICECQRQEMRSCVLQDTPSYGTAAALTQTCHQIRQESWKMFLAQSTFQFMVCPYHHRQGFDSFARCIGHEGVAALRNIIFTVDVIKMKNIQDTQLLESAMLAAVADSSKCPDHIATKLKLNVILLPKYLMVAIVPNGGYVDREDTTHSVALNLRDLAKSWALSVDEMAAKRRVHEELTRAASAIKNWTMHRVLGRVRMWKKLGARMSSHDLIECDRLLKLAASDSYRFQRRRYIFAGGFRKR